MEVINCPRCGKIFTMIKDPLCTACMKKEEEIFISVKNHIEENPQCTLQELADETGVSTKKILQFIRDGRLEISKGMAGTLRCDSCNAPITSGRYCDTCLVEIDQDIKDMFGKIPQERSGPRAAKMHIMPKKKV